MKPCGFVAAPKLQAGNSFYDNLADLFEAKSRRERSLDNSPWSRLIQTARDHGAKFVFLKEYIMINKSD